MKNVDHIKELMKVKGYFGSQKCFSENLGVTQQNISKWILGKTEMPYVYAQRIENITNGKFKAVDLISSETKSFLSLKN